jgi:hypothetical protein
MNPNFLKILWKWWKPVDWLGISVTGKVFAYPKEIQEQIDTKWNEMYERETAKGKKMRDSPLYRIDSLDITEETCRISLWVMKYSQLFIPKHVPSLLESIDPLYYPNGIAVGTLIETSDGYFIFGIRGKTHAGREGGEIAMIGGTLQPDETQVSSYQWFVDHLYTEIKEETWVWSQYVCDTKLVGIQRMSNGGIAFTYYVKLLIEKDSVLENFEKDSDEELASLKFLPGDEVIGFLRESSCDEQGNIKRSLGMSIEYMKEILQHKL